MASSRQVPLLFLDIDGTVREGKDDALGRFVNGPGDVRVFPEAVVMMRRWKQAGGRIIGVSNQGGIALGLVDREQVRQAMLATSHQAGHLLDRLVWCSHHPDSPDLGAARCWCRKPRIGMLVQAAADLSMQTGEEYPNFMALMVGDRPEDEACAAAADVDFQWAADWRAQAAMSSPAAQ